MSVCILGPGENFVRQRVRPGACLLMIGACGRRVVGVSFLDRLKREADQQRAQQEAVDRERESRDALYKGEIEPRMKALNEYLEKLVSTLQQVKPQVSVKMPIQGYGDLGAQPMWDFKIDHERRHRSFVINMSWTLRVDPETTPVVRAEGVTRIKTLTSVFRHNHLGGIKEEKRSPTGDITIASFHARGYIKAQMQATISAEDPTLRLTFHNATWLGTSRRQLLWQQIDDNLFDRMARFIAREDDSLFTEELPEELRQRLRGDAVPAAVTPDLSELAAAASIPAASTLGVPTKEIVPVPGPASTPKAAPAAPSIASTPKATLAAPAGATAPENTGPALSTTPSMIPAPPPPDAGEMIPIDDSKLDAAAFMVRMNVTLNRLRDEEDDGTGGKPK